MTTGQKLRKRRQYYQRLVQASAAGEFPALDSESQAACYRTTTTPPRCCVIGIAVPKSRYTQHTFESNSLGDLLSRAVITAQDLERWTGCDVDELGALQYWHDAYACGSECAGEPWNHAGFVAFLQDQIFPDLAPKEIPT